MSRARIPLFTSIALALSCTAVSLPAAEPASGTDAVPTMWDLSDLYKTPEAWTAAYEKTKAATEKLESYRGTLGGSADALFVALDAISSVNRETARLGVYAESKADEDLRKPAEQERRQQAESLGALIGQKTSWLNPEIIAIGAAKVESFEAERKELRDRFDFTLKDILRAAPHTLSPETESVLALSADPLEQAKTVRDQLIDADLPYPQFALPNGETVRLDQPAYERYRQAGDREERKAVFDAFWGALHRYEGTIGAAMTGHVMGDVFKAKARKFDDSLSAALFQSNMPASVYKTLIEEAHAALPTLHRYLRMRRERLGITDELAYYDNYPSMFPLSPTPSFSVRESETLTLAALAPLGPGLPGADAQGVCGTMDERHAP